MILIRACGGRSKRDFREERVISGSSSREGGAIAGDGSGAQAAAVIIAAAGLAAIFSVLRTQERLNDPYVTAVQETYYYYDNQIRMLYREAEPLLTANPDIKSELKLGMGELDSLSAQIIRDLHDNIASQEVVEALITNYRLRIELMEDMLQLMRKNEEGTKKTTGNEL